jgi:hypothetical protein
MKPLVMAVFLSKKKQTNICIEKNKLINSFFKISKGRFIRKPVNKNHYFISA